MTIRSTAGRGLLALVVLLLATGTAFAIDPSGSPSASPDASASEATSPEATATPVPSVSESVAPSTPPVRNPDTKASPEPSESPATSEPSETPDESNESDESDGPPSADKVADIVGRLKAAGITATADQIQDLAAKVGVGGAVRVMAFAQASGKTPAQILAMFESGKGWGQIDHELGLSIGPGIGWIMGHGHGNGHGQGHGNGPKSEKTTP